MLIKCTVDARGLVCPAPLLMTRQALNDLMPGECVEALATDNALIRDIHRLVELSSHRLIEFEQFEHHFRYVLEKGE